MPQKNVIHDDGQKYYFFQEAFQKAVTDYIAAQGMTNSKFNEIIGEKASVSEATVYNWYKRGNRPNDINALKIIGEYIHVDYNEWIKLDNAHDPICKFNENDTKLVHEIFSNSLEILSEWAMFRADGNVEIGPQIQYRRNNEQSLQRLRRLHIRVNQQCFMTTDTVRKLLHRTLIETEEIITNRGCDAWDEYCKEEIEGNTIWEADSTFLLLQYYMYDSRSDIVHDSDINARAYILDEISFAGDLKLAYVDPDDAFYEFDMRNLDDFEKYGYVGELEITPVMVFLDQLTQYLTCVYSKIFAGII